MYWPNNENNKAENCIITECLCHYLSLINKAKRQYSPMCDKKMGNTKMTEYIFIANLQSMKRNTSIL